MKCAGEYKRGKKFSFKHRQKISENRKGIIPSWQLNKEKKNEIYKKISKALSGKPQPWNQKENHHNWQGGITELNLQIRGALKYKHWRKAIFERDNYTCQFCNGRGIKIIADHKKKFAQILFENNIKTLKDALKCEELWNLDNGQTLCRECHRKTETFGGGKFYGGKIKMAY